MRLRDRVWTIRAVVPTASMADIAFLLIIFFMLTTSFSAERTRVVLPDSIIRSEVSREASIIAVTAEGEIAFTSGQEESRVLSGPQELGELIRDITTLAPNQEFVVKADRNTRYQAIDQVLDALRNNGALRIGLLTRAEPVRRQQP
jgi:biopolymer transport protein ExbD